MARPSPFAPRTAPDDCVLDLESVARGFYCDGGEPADAVIRGLTIVHGSAAAGGAMSFAYASSPTVVECVLSSNTANTGGAVACDLSGPTFLECTIVSNTSVAEGGGIFCDAQSTPNLTGCVISGNSAGTKGGGIYCYDRKTHCVLSACTISGNTAANAGGGLWCDKGPLIVTDCLIEGNSANQGGGARCGGYAYTEVEFVKCTFADNLAYYDGGAIYSGCSTRVTDCLIVQNRALDDGGGIYFGGRARAMINCTVAGNTAGGWGGGVCTQFTWPVTLRNSIFAGNSANLGPEIASEQSAKIRVLYSDIVGGAAAVYLHDPNDSVLEWEAGSIDADPLFVDPDGPDDDPNMWSDNDYRLSGGSSCVDAGNNDFVPADSTDLDGDGDTSEPIPWDSDGKPTLRGRSGHA